MCKVEDTHLVGAPNHGDHEALGRIDGDTDVPAGVENQIVAIDAGVELRELLQSGQHRLDDQGLDGDLVAVAFTEGPAHLEQAGGVDIVEGGDVRDLCPALGHVGGDGATETRHGSPLVRGGSRFRLVHVLV